jgi:hypothetical protein
MTNDQAPMTKQARMKEDKNDQNVAVHVLVI